MHNPTTPSHARFIRIAATSSLGLIVALFAIGNGHAAPWRDKTAPPPAQQADLNALSAANGNTVVELKALMDGHQLTELRTTYNGSYGASLLFNTDTLTYYVALFQEKEFWRVIKTEDFANAESVYKTFVDQTLQLAQANIDTIRLQANKRYNEKLVAQQQQQLQNLQAEVEQQRQQSAQVSAALQQAKQQSVSLNTDLHATNAELNAINSRIEALKAIQANPNLSLPEPAPSPQVQTGAATAGLATPTLQSTH